MRLRLLTLLLVALPLLAAGVLLTRAVVNGERDRAESEALRIALWRLDARATALVVGEASRAPEAYRSFWTPSEVFGERLTPAGRVLLPSPLLGLPQAPLHLHVRLVGSTLSSPQIPSGRERTLALDGLIAASDLEEAERRFGALRFTLGREPALLLADLPPPPDASDSIVNPIDAPRQVSSPLAPTPVTTPAATPEPTAKIKAPAAAKTLDSTVAQRSADKDVIRQTGDSPLVAQVQQQNLMNNWNVNPNGSDSLQRKSAIDEFDNRSEALLSSQNYARNDNPYRSQKAASANIQAPADFKPAPGSVPSAKAEQAPIVLAPPGPQAGKRGPVVAGHQPGQPAGTVIGTDSTASWRTKPNTDQTPTKGSIDLDENQRASKQMLSKERSFTSPSPVPGPASASATAVAKPQAPSARTILNDRESDPAASPAVHAADIDGRIMRDRRVVEAKRLSAPAAPTASLLPAEEVNAQTPGTMNSLDSGFALTNLRLVTPAVSPPSPTRPATTPPPTVAVSSPATQASTAGLVEARWAGEHWLLLARRAKLDGHEELQAAALRWDDLRTQLTSRLTDLLPQAQLVPRGPDDPPERCLAALPIRLDPGPLPSVPLSSAARWTLGIAWGALLAGLVGGATLLLAANRLAERRATFVSAVTHELRTPLTALRLHADLLADPRVADDGARRGKRVDVLRAEAGRLAHLIDNVLDYARLERRRPPEPRPVSLADLLAPLVPRLSTRLAAAGLELATAQVPPCMVRCDPAAVERILLNLADNAAKYAANSATKTITLSALMGKGSLELRLRDHGPGLAADVRARLFLPFARSAEAAAGSAPGVGLGLALCRRLARAQGGDLRLEEPDGGGVEAVLVLPLG